MTLRNILNSLHYSAAIIFCRVFLHHCESFEQEYSLVRHYLDIETEYELKETMLKLFKGKLVFFATHRLHWMLDMDQILVLNHGKLVEIGTHQELIAKRGHYYQLVKSQLEGF